jgi:hypothetical protein
MILLSIIIIIIIGYLKGKADTIQHSPNYRTSGSKAKWRIDELGSTIPITAINTDHAEQYHWWYFNLYLPEYYEKSICSSTILVAFTDQWHKLNFISYRLTDILITIFAVKETTPWALLLILVLPLTRWVGFTKSYRK